jgi:hypothetical protein
LRAARIAGGGLGDAAISARAEARGTRPQRREVAYHGGVTTAPPSGAWALSGEALAYAAAVHDGQLRKGTSIPYLSHLLAVAALVAEDGGSPVEVAAALLHDAAEDHGGSARLADIERRFGPAVAGIVAECSDTLETVKEPWRERKQRYLDHLERASAAAVRVGLADKVANLRTIVDGYRALGEPFWRRFDEDADPLWYYRSVLEILGRRTSSPFVAELRALYQALAADVVAAPHPLPDSYWVVPGRLLAGEYPGAAEDSVARRQVRRLSWCGVTDYIDLTTAGEYRLKPYLPLLEDGASHRRFAIADRGVPEPEEMEAILAAIDGSFAAGRTVYVHCFGGIGRTGTVIGCWLVRRGTPGEQAIELLARWRGGTPDVEIPSPETWEQRELVLAWR